MKQGKGRGDPRAKGGLMMKIQILGTGCPKCSKTYERVEEAVRDAGVEAEVEKVQELKAIMEFGVMVTPAVVVDGRVRVAGKIPSVEEIKVILRESPAEGS
jgi:small redox-active disulfide protein 2